MSKILKNIMYTFFILISTLVVLAFLILTIPQIVINDTTLSYASRFLPRYGYNIDWRYHKVRASSVKIFHKHIHLSFEGLCISSVKETGKQQFCFESVDIHATVGWENKKFVVSALGPLHINDGRISIELPPSNPQKKQESFFSSLIKISSYFKNTKFYPFSINLNHLEVFDNSKKITGRISLFSDINEKNEISEVSLFGSTEELIGLGKIESIALALHGNNYGKLPSFNWNIGGDIHTVFQKNSHLSFQSGITSSPDHSYSYGIQAAYADDTIKSALGITGIVQNQQWKGNITASAAGFLDQIQKVSVTDCLYAYQQAEKNKQLGKLAVNCPIHVDLTPLLLPSATWSKLVTVPANLDFLLQTNLETDYFPSLDSKISGTFDLGLSPIEQDFVKANGKAHTLFSGIPSRYPEGWNIVTELNSSIILPYFQKVAQALEKTAFAIPAPLNVLDGSIEAGLRGQIDLTQSSGKLPLVFKTQLHAADEKLDVSGTGTFSYGKVIHDSSPENETNNNKKQESKKGKKWEGTLDLEDVKITLPTLGISTLPALFPDKRIQKTDHLVKKDPFDFSLHVTTREKPISLVSNVARESIPIQLDLKIENGKTAGTVSIAPTTLHFFQKNAQLERLTLILKDPQESSELAGRIRIDHAEYKIDLFILGTLAKPRIVFESTPPLSEEQMISVLLYGRTYNDLDETQRSSVSSTSEVLAQQALGVGSLFILASTPVQSISYDPVTGAFSAKLRLTEGTLVNFSTQEKKQQFGLRKTLSGNWAITTYVENDQETQKKMGVAFFEWIKRY